MVNQLKKDFSIRQEDNIANTVGGRVTPSLGVGHFKKDIIVDDASFLIECKTTSGVKDYFTIRKYWLDNNVEEAKEQGCDNSAIAFNFSTDGTNYYVIDERLMLYLLDKLKKDYLH